MIKNIQSDKLLITFSGGKTSAFMSNWLLQNRETLPYRDIVVVFANTGEENIKTYEFVEKCNNHFNLNLVMLEALVVFEKGKGTKHKIINSVEELSKNGEPFEDVIKKYGIPNQEAMHCTRELKMQPITSYVRSLGWKKGDYDTAIGIRYDELDRISGKCYEDKVIYPLVDLKITKKDVHSFFEQQPFNLMLPEHQGNCKWCWKKSMRKLLTIADENPEYFDFPMRMEEKYGQSGSFKSNSLGDRVFFRNKMSSKDILEKAKLPFNKFVDNYFVTIDNYDEELDKAGACNESCEIY
jgi:hypothetical protein